MSRNLYPRIGESRKGKHGGKCSACGKRGEFRVDIEVSYMRGDDEVVWACDEHRKDVGALTASWKKVP